MDFYKKILSLIIFI